MANGIELRLEKLENEIKKLRKEYMPNTKRFFRAAGSWKKIDTEKIKKKIYESR